MKIRYMKDKIKIRKKIQLIFICVLAYMLNFKIYAWHKFKTTNKN